MTSVKNEIWKEIRLNSKGQTTRYAVSNRGRISSFKSKADDRKILKGTVVNGYPALKVRISEEDYQFYVHKLVAQYFVKKAGRSKEFVLHHDYDKLNNKASNLRWASKEEMTVHQQKSPLVKEYRARTKAKGHKLTAAKVRQIKTLLGNKNRRVLMSEIAGNFGISQMQLYRIKSGENWGHVKVSAN
jgi:hypothetical protein